jgi:hypothetical protein
VEVITAVELLKRGRQVTGEEGMVEVVAEVESSEGWG